MNDKVIRIDYKNMTNNDWTDPETVSQLIHDQSKKIEQVEAFDTDAVGKIVEDTLNSVAKVVSDEVYSKFMDIYTQESERLFNKAHEESEKARKKTEKLPVESNSLSFIHWVGIIVAASIVLTFIFAEPVKNDSESSKQETWMAHGQLAVKQKLKDSSSAEFRNVYFNRGKDGVPVACGEVNAKNSFGAYSGYQRFVSAGKPELTYLEQEVADFYNVWVRLCQ